MLTLDPKEHNLIKKLFWNSKVFIQENVIENVVCTMAAILSGPPYVIIAICFVFLSWNKHLRRQF